MNNAFTISQQLKDQHGLELRTSNLVCDALKGAPEGADPQEILTAVQTIEQRFEELAQDQHPELESHILDRARRRLVRQLDTTDEACQAALEWTRARTIFEDNGVFVRQYPAVDPDELQRQIGWPLARLAVTFRKQAWTLGLMSESPRAGEREEYQREAQTFLGAARDLERALEGALDVRHERIMRAKDKLREDLERKSKMNQEDAAEAFARLHSPHWGSRSYMEDYGPEQLQEAIDRCLRDAAKARYMSDMLRRR